MSTNHHSARLHAFRSIASHHCHKQCVVVLVSRDPPSSVAIRSVDAETLSDCSIYAVLRIQSRAEGDERDEGGDLNKFTTKSRENSLRQAPENGVLSEKASSDSENKKLHIEAIPPLNDDKKMNRDEEPASLISFESVETPLQTAIIRQPSPPPVLADVQDLIPPSDPVTEADHGMEYSLSGGLVSSESPLQLHISTTLMDSFMKLAKSNTDKNLETCGVLAGSLKNRKFYVTALIIPKQESTSDSCQTTNEEEIFEVQDKQSLFPLGWIHTHPTQSCFMSSIDVHTHYSYQVCDSSFCFSPSSCFAFYSPPLKLFLGCEGTSTICEHHWRKSDDRCIHQSCLAIMLPEAIAIVMAPKDSSRNHGIFRLTTPGGMSVIRQCPRRGFHPHDPPPDGGPIYKQCTDVYMDPKVKFDVIDLR
ncbi:hypothetical protein RHGRI_023784 [Rhododendron griersonianum]|uniref:MPN domain-containing protein n=1 Tax=Rhododendron griersonianum TaxID=479676 RepID=A0AAV6J4X5_9ERIC|nr:hypothetical protein RHGRI_023784 [Rhododendron griersonianum]